MRPGREHSRAWLHAAVAVAVLLVPLACAPDKANKMADMETQLTDDVVTVNGHSFKVWVADDPDERERGLMYVTKEEMAPLEDGTERGMLFVFPVDQSASHGFWMRNTVIPLDIAFIRVDGTIVGLQTMAPLDENPYRSDAPYRYALEVNANVFSRLGIKKGDTVRISEGVLKSPG